MLKINQLLSKYFSGVNSSSIFTGFILTIIIAYSLTISAYPTIFYPWYANTEEFPYIQEILRFVTFDFRQEFFDIPGTPLMMIGTFLWSVYYWVCAFFGHPDTVQGIRYFSFKNIQELYLLMRGLSYLFYVLSILLTYFIAHRLTNRVGGLVAALLLSLSPIYCQTTWHLRIEPISLALVLLAVSLILLALERQSYGLYFFSGVMAGLAMAARYPSVLAGIPVLLFYCALYPHIFTNRKPRRVNLISFVGILLLILIGGMQSLLIKVKLLQRNFLTDIFLITTEVPYPKATGAIQKLWLLLFTIVAIALVIFYVFPKTRHFLQKLIYSSSVTVSAGFLTGIVLGLPTIFWSGNYFLSALEAFSTRNQVSQPLMDNFFNVLYFFIFGALNMGSSTSLPPDVGILYTRWDGILLVIGLFVIVAQRRKMFYPVVAGAILGVVVQYGKLQTTRHIIAWLPYFLLIIALPLSVLYDKPQSVLKNRKWFYPSFVLCLCAFIFITSYKIQFETLNQIKLIYQEKIGMINEMDKWLEGNLTTNEKVFHVCCDPVNQEAILSWMQASGVKVPEGIKKSDQAIIWFGDKEPLVAVGKGYIAIGTNSFKIPYIDYYKKLRPQSATDPFNDSHFKLKKQIDGDRGNSFRIYSFDFKE